MNEDIIKNVTLEETERYNVVEYYMPLVLPKFKGSTRAGIMLGTVPGCVAIGLLHPPVWVFLPIALFCYPAAYILSGYIRIWRAKKNYTMIGLENNHGDYIGGIELRGFLDSHSIAPEIGSDDATACTIGWSVKEQKYYGWSHRANRGFAIGDQSFYGDTIHSEEAARTSAVGFARSVS